MKIKTIINDITYNTTVENNYKLKKNLKRRHSIRRK